MLRDRRAGMEHVGGGEQEALQVRGARRAVAREVESVGTCGRPEVAVLQPILARQRGDLAAVVSLGDRDGDRPLLRRHGERVDRIAVAHPGRERVRAGLDAAGIAREVEADPKQRRVRDDPLAVEDVGARRRDCVAADAASGAEAPSGHHAVQLGVT